MTKFTQEQAQAMYEFIKIMADDDFQFLSDAELQDKAQGILQAIDTTDDAQAGQPEKRYVVGESCPVCGEDAIQVRFDETVGCQVCDWLADAQIETDKLNNGVQDA